MVQNAVLGSKHLSSQLVESSSNGLVLEGPYADSYAVLWEYQTHYGLLGDMRATKHKKAQYCRTYT